MRTLLLAWVMLVLSFHVYADEPVVEPIKGEAAKAIPFTKVAEMISRQGEGEVNFLKRVGQRMTDFSKGERVEICGQVAEKYVATSDDAGYMLTGVVLVTNHSNIACVEHLDVVPEGFVATARTIHNHGYTPMFRVNAVDVSITNGQFTQNTLRGVRVQNRFSAQDLTESGYLATKTGLLYQDGRGKHTDYGDYGVPYTGQAVAKN